MLTIDTIPLKQFSIFDPHFRLKKINIPQPSANRKSKIYLFIFFVHAVTAATTTILFKLQPFGRGFFVFCRDVVTFLTLCALQNYVISRHYLLPF